MDASSRWLLGEMPKDGAAHAHGVSALFDGYAKVAARPHRQSVDVVRGLLPLHFEARLVDHRIERIAIENFFS
jgi:hypothetical protein